MFGEMGFVLLIIFLTIVVPLWLLLHYITRWKQSRGLSRDDERMLEELWESAVRMEERIETLERILDDQGKDWRKSK